MDMEEVAFVVENVVLNSATFPYRTGQLRNNFFNYTSGQMVGDTYSIDILTTPLVNYGKILQDRASIRYRTKNHYIYHKNKHFRYIDKIINRDVVSALELEFGVRRVRVEDES